jgi:hypothetical protein
MEPTEEPLMAKLSNHQSSQFAKIIFIGNSGTGKTGGLTSLVKAGYKLRILDLDNGLDSLRQHVLHECPESIDNVDFETLRDKFKATSGGPIVDGVAKAYIDATKLMTKWSDDTIPAEWGPDTIFVLDSLTALGRAAFEWAKSLNPSSKDPRQWYFSAQQSVENIIALLTSESFRANVIVISHVNFVEESDGTTKGYTSAIGRALGPIIPKYFNTLILAEASGMGKNVRRRIKTVPTGMIDLKNPAPFKLDAELPLETGLATVFATIKGDTK